MDMRPGQGPLMPTLAPPPGLGLPPGPLGLPPPPGLGHPGYPGPGEQRSQPRNCVHTRTQTMRASDKNNETKLMQSLALMQILEIGLCIPLWPGQPALLYDDPLLIQSWAPGLTLVARPSYVGAADLTPIGRRNAISPGPPVMSRKSRMSGGHWRLDTCNETRAPCKSFANCDMSVHGELWRLRVSGRGITSRPPSCTCNNLTTFYGLYSRNYIIYAHFSFPTFSSFHF